MKKEQNNDKADKRIELFLSEYKELSKKHGIDFSARYTLENNELAPRIKVFFMKDENKEKVCLN